jgi:hypothetical protein
MDFWQSGPPSLMDLRFLNEPSKFRRPPMDDNERRRCAQRSVNFFWDVSNIDHWVGGALPHAHLVTAPPLATIGSTNRWVSRILLGYARIIVTFSATANC